MSASTIVVHRTIPPFRELRKNATLANEKVALVPTMGALHAGHISLIHTAAQTNHNIVVSIFVNPAQFAPTEDLDSYPRTFTSDLAKLQNLNVQLESEGALGRIKAVFAPTVEVLYPSGIPLDTAQQKGAFVTVQPLASKLEGGPRPHFFRGVATVVLKLFNIVQPDVACFGQKDVQQCVILKRMVEDLHVPVELVIGATVREDDGLAMSSRNVYLGDKRRAVAPGFYKALRQAEAAWLEALGGGRKTVSRSEVLERFYEGMKGLGEKVGVQFVVEYVSIADFKELEEMEYVDTKKGGILSAAVRVLPVEEGQGPVRLIDNIILKGPETNW
jgi:pantoate--beta-alanine ligase